MTDLVHNCAVCKFYLPSNPDQGICRRFPPEVIAVAQNAKGEIGTKSFFPPMLKTGWCGEFLMNLKGLQ